VFLGYSFNDPNVQALFSHLKRLFGDKLPPSYLVQFRPNTDFATRLAQEYGVRAISCRDLYLDALDDSAAFYRFMRDLCATVIAKKSSQELEEMFKPSVPRSVLVVARTDVEMLAQALARLPVGEAIRAFRGVCDLASIPTEMQGEVASMFVELCRNATEQAHMTDLNGAVFNLQLSDPAAAIRAFSGCCAMANLLPPQSGMLPSHMFRPHLRGYDDPVIRLFGIASAFQLLTDWGRTPGKGFYDWVSFMLNQPPSRAQMPPELCRAIDGVLNVHYARGKTTYEQPLDRADRLARLPGMGAPPLSSTYQTLYKRMSAMMPKATPRPYQS
jgi:SIR2-like domain